MVFFRRPVSSGNDSTREGVDRRLSHPSMDAFDNIPAELCAEQGLAYLRLLNQLARCGIDAAGPPLLVLRPYGNG